MAIPPILSEQSGTVITATVSSPYGNYVVIDHSGGLWCFSMLTEVAC